MVGIISVPSSTFGNNNCRKECKTIIDNECESTMTTKSRQSIIVMFILATAILTAFTPKLNRNDVMKDVLFSSIVWVESKGNTKAKSTDGSVGVIQIKPVMVNEVNRICKIRNIDKRFTLKDRVNPLKSREMFWIFQEFYHPNVNWNDISMEDLESIARKWNGGPAGDKKARTKKYWRKVAKRLSIEFNRRDLADIS